MRFVCAGENEASELRAIEAENIFEKNWVGFFGDAVSVDLPLSHTPSRGHRNDMSHFFKAEDHESGGEFDEEFDGRDEDTLLGSVAFQLNSPPDPFLTTATQRKAAATPLSLNWLPVGHDGASLSALFDLLWSAGKRIEGDRIRKGVAAAEVRAIVDDDVAGRRAPPPAFRIPDTVFVHHSRITRWYFTSKDGSFRTKTRGKLTTAAVTEHFSAISKKQVPYAIQVVHLEGSGPKLPARMDEGSSPLRKHLDAAADLEDPHPPAIAASADGGDRSGSGDGVVMTCVRPEDLHDVLTSSSFSGLVQLFVVPRNERASVARGGAAGNNGIIVANWTPNVLYVERRTNTLDMGAHVPVDERTTVSLASRFVKASSLSSTHTARRIEEACRDVAARIEIAAGGDTGAAAQQPHKLSSAAAPTSSFRVTSMVAYFKIDEKDRVNLLCTSVLRGAAAAVEGTLGREINVIGTSSGSRSPPRSGGATRRPPLSSPGRATDSRSSSPADDGRPPRGSKAQPHRGGPATAAARCTLCGKSEPALATGVHHASSRSPFSKVARRHVLLPWLMQGEPSLASGSADFAVRLASADSTLRTEADFQSACHNDEWMDGMVPLCFTCLERVMTAVEGVSVTGERRQPGAMRVAKAPPRRPHPRPLSTERLPAVQRSSPIPPVAGTNEPLRRT